MFLPLHDGVPLRRLRYPIGNWSLIALNVAIWLAGSMALLGHADTFDLSFGVVPSVLFGPDHLAANLALVPPPLTLLTSQFIHGGWWHLIGNMLFLWVFGDNVEDAMGTLRYVAFYLLCGVAGGLTYCLAASHSQAPLIGASGAISGVVAAYVLLFPLARIFVLVFSFLPLRVPAIVIVSLWIAFQIGSAFTSRDSSIAWWAHVGGLLTGAVLTPFLKAANVPIWLQRRA